METKLIQSTDKRETRTACGPRLLFLSAERIGGNRDNRDRFQSWISFDLARLLITVRDGQLDIHQDEIRPLFRDRCERLSPFSTSTIS